MVARIKNSIKSAITMLKTEKKIPISKPVNTTDLLKDKVALITGGSGGIGYAIAESFINSGCKVIIAGTNEKKLNDLCKRLGDNARCLQINVLDVSAIPDKIKEAALLFEENRIDILVNSAGVVNHSSFENMSESEYDLIMDINAKGTFFMCQAMSAYMIEHSIKGHILNVTSSSALRPAWTPYQMSKWAIRGFTLGLADTLIPHGIIVNAIAPGPVATEMLGKKADDDINNSSSPIGRYALPSEIASLATFMVSELGDMIVGDTFYMTGGCGTIQYNL